MRVPRYTVVSLFMGNRPYAQPAKFSNRKVATNHFAKHGNSATLIDNKTKRVLKHRPVKL